MSKKKECNTNCAQQTNDNLNQTEEKQPEACESQDSVDVSSCEINKLNQEIESLKKELEKNNDLLLRNAAEFDNYKKREATSRERMADYIKSETIKAILPSIDNVKRALEVDATSPEFATGVVMTIKGLIDTLKSLGLEEINPLGEAFDVDYHSAVMRVEDESVGKNIVTEVLQPGYKFGETVIRYAMVKVANCD